jgi:hypothetical protein
MSQFDALNFGFGWVDDPAEVQRVCYENDIKDFAEVAPACMAAAPTDGPICLTKYMDKLWGESDWVYNQGSCGSCVAMGAGLAAEILVAMDTIDNGAENPGRLDSMSIYWGSRVEIGGGRLWGQGSVGVWAAQWLQKYGVLPAKKYNSVDLSAYSSSLCCSSYASRGVPDDLEPIARLHPVAGYAAVTTWDELVAAISSGYPVTVASSQGFAMQRDANGFARPSGRWPHQMCFVGIDLKDQSAVCQNSWGKNWISGPKPAWMPEGSFKVDKQTVNRMLSQGDSFALSNLKGWPKKTLNWSVLNW